MFRVRIEGRVRVRIVFRIRIKVRVSLRVETGVGVRVNVPVCNHTFTPRLLGYAVQMCKLIIDKCVCEFKGYRLHLVEEKRIALGLHKAIRKYI